MIHWNKQWSACLNLASKLAPRNEGPTLPAAAASDRMSLIEVVGTSFRMKVEILNLLLKPGLAHTEMQLSASAQKTLLYLFSLSLLALWLEQEMPRPSQACMGCQS